MPRFRENLRDCPDRAGIFLEPSAHDDTSDHASNFASPFPAGAFNPLRLPGLTGLATPKMSGRVHFAPLRSTDAEAISRLQRKLFARELTEPVAEIEQILRNTEEHMVCNLSYGLFDGNRMVGYVFAYVESHSLFYSREEEVIYIKEIALLNGYEGYLRQLFQKLLAQRDAYTPGLAIEAHALAEALAAWRRLKRFFRSQNLQLDSIAEPPKAGRPSYQLLRLDFVEAAPETVVPPMTIPIAGSRYRDTAIGVVTDPRQWQSLRQQWNEILRSSAQTTVFQSFDYLWEWWKHFGIWHDLHMLVIQRGNTILGIAPLMIEHTSIPGTTLRRMALIGSLQEMGRPQFLFGRDVDICTSAMLAYFDENPRLWDVLSIGQPAAAITGMLHAHFAKRGYRVEMSNTVSTYLDLARTDAAVAAENMTGTLTSSATGDIAMRTVSDWPALEAAIDVHCAIEERQPTPGASPDISSDREHYFFYTGLARAFGATQSFVSRILERDGKAVASTVGLLWQDVFQSLKRVRDNSGGAEAVDTLLAYELDDLRRKAIARYAFMEPAEPRTLPFAAETVAATNIRIYRPRSASMALYFLATAFNRDVHGMLARALARFRPSSTASDAVPNGLP